MAAKVAAMYYVLVDAFCKDAFFISDDDSVPREFSSDVDAVEAAKDYNGDRLVMKVVGQVIEKTTHRYVKK